MSLLAVADTGDALSRRYFSGRPSHETGTDSHDGIAETDRVRLVGVVSGSAARRLLASISRSTRTQLAYQ